MHHEIGLYGYQYDHDGSSIPLQDERNQPEGYCVYVMVYHGEDDDDDRYEVEDETFKTLEEARTFAGQMMEKYPDTDIEEYSIPYSERSFFYGSG
jgi:hypothetical protein